MTFDFHGCVGVVALSWFLVGDPGSLGSGPGSTMHCTDVQGVEPLNATLPSPLTVHSRSAELVTPMLCLQVNTSFRLVEYHDFYDVVMNSC